MDDSSFVISVISLCVAVASLILSFLKYTDDKYQIGIDIRECLIGIEEGLWCISITVINKEKRPISIKNVCFITKSGCSVSRFFVVGNFTSNFKKVNENM